MMTRVLLGAVAAFAVTAVASAASFTVTYNGTVADTAVGSNFTGFGTIANHTSGGNGGLFNFTKTSGSYQGQYKAFCMQIGDLNFANPYTSKDLASAPEVANQNPPNPIGIGADKAKVLSAIARKNWSAAVSANDLNLTKAFQVAIWEIVYTDMQGVNNTAQLLAWAKGLVDGSNAFTGGNYVVFNATQGSSNVGVLTALQSIFASLTETDLNYNGPNTHSAWVSVLGQDVVTVPVPMPVLLAGFGLIGGIAVRRRMTKA